MKAQNLNDATNRATAPPPSHKASVQRPSDEHTARVTPLGSALVAFIRTLVLSLKKGAVLSIVKKSAFLRLGSLTTTRRLGSSVAAHRKTTAATSTWHEVIKSVVLGTTVFATYETLAYHWLSGLRDPDVPGYLSRYVTIKLGGSDADADNNNNAEGEGKEDNTKGKFRLKKSIYAEAAERSSVLSHVGAGLCSGVAQSVVQIAWEQAIVRDHPHSWRYMQRRALHHSIGYASLFGTYEFLRRGMTRSVHDGFVILGRDDPDKFLELRDWLGPDYEWMIRREDGVYDVTPVTLFTSFLAGGFAGQAHHVVSHYSRGWLTKRGRTSKLLIRPTLAAFGPTSIIFLAFQFGGELSERMVEEVSGFELGGES